MVNKVIIRKEKNMDNLEKIEKLRKKADISYQEAKEVLEKCQWDLLDAVIELENRGKLKGEPPHKEESHNTHEAPKSPKQVAESYHSYEQSNQGEHKDKGLLKTLWDGIIFLLKKGGENKLIVSKESKILMEIPVLLLIVLLLFSCFIVLAVMVIGLFFGLRYSFSGPELGKKAVNNFMDKAGYAADDIKDSFSRMESYPKNQNDNEKD